jgi:predicted nucleic acid-binding protein
MARILLDSSALYAIADSDDKWHQAMVRAVHGRSGDRIVPVSVLAEACYLIGAHLGPKSERPLVRAAIGGEFQPEGLSLRDFARAEGVLAKYTDATVGFVGASVVAVPERLNIRTIAATDRRHIHLFRPKHCRAFEIIP